MNDINTTEEATILNPNQGRFGFILPKEFDDERKKNFEATLSKAMAEKTNVIISEASGIKVVDLAAKKPTPVPAAPTPEPAKPEPVAPPAPVAQPQAPQQAQPIAPILNTHYTPGQQQYVYNPFYGQQQMIPQNQYPPMHPVAQQPQGNQYYPGAAPTFAYVPVPQGYVPPATPQHPPQQVGPIGQLSPQVAQAPTPPQGGYAQVYDPAQLTRQFVQAQNQNQQPPNQ